MLLSSLLLFKRTEDFSFGLTVAFAGWFIGISGYVISFELENWFNSPIDEWINSGWLSIDSTGNKTAVWFIGMEGCWIEANWLKVFSCSLRRTLCSGDWGLLKTHLSWMFALDNRVDAGVGAANNDIDWFMCSAVVKFFTGSSVNSLVSCANWLLLWRNLERRLGLFSPCGRKNDGFASLGGTGGETSLAGFFTVMLFWSEYWETGVNRCNLSCLLEDCEMQLMSSRTRVDDWLNWPSSSRLLTSRSKFSRREIKFDWRFMTEFMLLELFFPSWCRQGLSSALQRSPWFCWSTKKECGIFFSAERMSVRDQPDISCWAQLFWTCSMRIVTSGCFLLSSWWTGCSQLVMVLSYLK